MLLYTLLNEICYLGPKEKTQQLRELVTLPKDLGLNPIIHMAAHSPLWLQLWAVWCSVLASWACGHGSGTQTYILARYRHTLNIFECYFASPLPVICKYTEMQITVSLGATVTCCEDRENIWEKPWVLIMLCFLHVADKAATSIQGKGNIL